MTKFIFLSNHTRKDVTMLFGRRKYINDSADMADVFYKISKEDNNTAEYLFSQKYYNQATYFLIQSCEKYIKYLICQKVDSSNKYFAQKLRYVGHSLDNSIDFLIEIKAGNDDILRQQLHYQIKNIIMKNTQFTGIYNAVRYPHYSERYHNHSLLEMTAADYLSIKNILNTVKNTLRDLDKIK